MPGCSRGASLSRAIAGPDCYLRPLPLPPGHPVAPPAAIAASLLFLSDTESDEPDVAARDAALELGLRLDRPVLLLDAACRADGQLDYLRATGGIVPRAPYHAVPGHLAALHFHAVRNSALFVSSLDPPDAATDEAFWHRTAEAFAGTLRRLLDMFAVVVIAAPGLTRSSRGLALSRQAHATILAVRDGPDAAARASGLRTRVDGAGGRAAGVVLTGCVPGRADVPTWT